MIKNKKNKNKKAKLNCKHYMIKKKYRYYFLTCYIFILVDRQDNKIIINLHT